MDKQEVKEMLKVINDPRPAALSYMAVRSDRTLVVEDAEPAMPEEPDTSAEWTELICDLFIVACAAFSGAACGAVMALML